MKYTLIIKTPGPDVEATFDTEKETIEVEGPGWAWEWPNYDRLPMPAGFAIELDKYGEPVPVSSRMTYKLKRKG